MGREETLHKLRARAMNLIFEEAPSAKRLKRTAIYLLRLSFHVARELTRNDCLLRAAALSYTTILSLVPVTALFMIYFKMAGKMETFSLKAQEWILRSFVADAAGGVIQYIDKFVDTLHTRALGIVGVIGMVFTTYSLFKTVEKSFNNIWNIRSHRTIAARFQILAALLIMVPIFLVSSLYLSGKLQELKILGGWSTLTRIVRMMYVVAPIVMTFLSIFFLYKYLPNTKVKTKPALAGAMVSTILFECAKIGFNLYVLKVIPYSKVYGSLGLLPVLMVWVYISWIIVLFGVELSFTLQNMKTLHELSLHQIRPVTRKY